MIPPEINHEHVLNAISEVDSVGIPTKRHSTKWSVLHDNRLYPPKLLLSIANRFVNGEELIPDDFSGGDESNRFLKALGFDIVPQNTRQGHYPLRDHSWTIHSATVAVKRMDKSTFLHRGTAVPQHFRFFSVWMILSLMKKGILLSNIRIGITRPISSFMLTELGLDSSGNLILRR